MAELERLPGASLMQRTTRKLTLTVEGELFLERGRRILGEAAEARAEIAERRGSLSGPLRVAGPIGFGTLHLGRILSEFLKAHPGIELTVDLDDRFIDVAADGYDAVIRHGPVEDSRLIAKPLASSRRLLVAAPSYLGEHGTPSSLRELGDACAILYSNRAADWRFRSREGETILRPRACLRVNNGIMMREAAIAGLGIALLPTFFIDAELASGSLRVVDVGAEAEGAQLFVAYPRNRSTSAKVTALLAHLKHAIGSPPLWG
ncbi:DNA-binding transcriptional LysR family regulator [Novosphingobium chloroacetimidivorans]|uniref:DNA-binding transcriptional LysR family regulator n=1 Tax=Novosphingobium chloroacetimidivorans TaxID=1428314 RepID=A0A7W7KD62_9SPHN|nr:LysR substrate-binding domain-containing protein [Novosphingobium chloroacetimidivorans]MBB4860325.1 DNA-binding transcriptional LysR family regulator [Novosphingobium chloroacetimidivorans]